MYGYNDGLNEPFDEVVIIPGEHGTYTTINIGPRTDEEVAHRMRIGSIAYIVNLAMGGVACKGTTPTRRRKEAIAGLAMALQIVGFTPEELQAAANLNNEVQRKFETD